MFFKCGVVFFVIALILFVSSQSKTIGRDQRISREVGAFMFTAASGIFLFCSLIILLWRNMP